MNRQTKEIPDFDRISEPVAKKIALALTKISGVARGLAWRNAGPEGMTPTQGQVLSLLRHRSPESLRLSEIAEALAVKPPTASEAVDTLLAKALVEKNRSVSDARALAISLTAEGREVATRIAGWPDFMMRGLRALSAEEQEIFYRGVLKMIRALQLEGQFPILQMCVTCTYFQPNVHANSDRPHHCGLVNAPFGDRHLRLECPEHKPASAAQAKRAFRTFKQARGNR